MGHNDRRVVVLAPMPLELRAIVTAFGLERPGGKGTPWVGRVGKSDVTAVHIGMGPAVTRDATARLLAESAADHVMIAGICGGLDPDLPVGTLINPAVLVDHVSGATYHHNPPGSAPTAGRLITTETVTLDHEFSRSLFAGGCIAVDMESAAVAEVCEPRGVPWSVYRCIGDRYFDGLLDERLIALTNPDGSGDIAAIEQLLASDPGLQQRLDQLGRDAAEAAKRAAEAAVRGCQDLDDS